jgi:hypothetical protein
MAAKDRAAPPLGAAQGSVAGAVGPPAAPPVADTQQLRPGRAAVGRVAPGLPGHTVADRAARAARRAVRQSSRCASGGRRDRVGRGKGTRRRTRRTVAPGLQYPQSPFRRAIQFAAQLTEQNWPTRPVFHRVPQGYPQHIPMQVNRTASQQPIVEYLRIIQSFDDRTALPLP